MRLRTKVVVVSLIILIGVVLVFVPFIAGPSAQCDDGTLCIPNQRQSVTRYFFGFGGESSYGDWPYSRFYYFCSPSC